MAETSSSTQQGGINKTTHKRPPRSLPPFLSCSSLGTAGLGGRLRPHLERKAIPPAASSRQHPRRIQPRELCYPSSLPGPISSTLPALLGNGVQINGELISRGKDINRLGPTPNLPELILSLRKRSLIRNLMENASFWA